MCGNRDLTVCAELYHAHDFPENTVLLDRDEIILTKTHDLLCRRMRALGDKIVPMRVEHRNYRSRPFAVRHLPHIKPGVGVSLVALIGIARFVAHRRSAERGVGQEGVRTGSARGSAYTQKKKKI